MNGNYVSEDFTNEIFKALKDMLKPKEFEKPKVSFEPLISKKFAEKVKNATKFYSTEGLEFELSLVDFSGDKPSFTVSSQFFEHVLRIYLESADSSMFYHTETKDKVTLSESGVRFIQNDQEEYYEKKEKQSRTQSQRVTLSKKVNLPV